MIISKKNLKGARYVDLAAAPVRSSAIRWYLSPDAELPFVLTVESATARYRVSLSLGEAEQLARDLSEYRTRGQVPLQFGESK